MWKFINLYSILALTTLLLATSSAAPPPAITIQEIEASPPDEETVDYMIPRLASKYGSESSWQGVMDPRLYVLTELDAPQEMVETRRLKRKLPSLSIVNPMEVLRQRLLLEIARKQMRENVARKAEENRTFLQNIGKRSDHTFRSFVSRLNEYQRPAQLSNYLNSKFLGRNLNDDSANDTA